MKKQEQQFEQLKDSVVGEVAVLLTDLKEDLTEIVDTKVNEAVAVLAGITAKGFEEVNIRLDRVDQRLDSILNENKQLRADINSQFDQVNKDIQLNRLLLN